MDQKNIVLIEHLNHYYQENVQKKQVLFDINLAIQSGETLILTGESGSGKTTLLSLIGCLRSVQAGSLKIFNQELCGVNENQLIRLRRRIGYVFQHFNLLDFMTVQQNVQVCLELQANFSPRNAKKQSEAIINEVGLGHKINAYPRELSGGQKQRVAIARALVHSPQLILADEPTAALDSKTGLEAIELIQRLVKQQGSAILIVTHDRRILHVADRIVRMEDGRVGRAYSEEISLILPTLTDRQLNHLTSNLELRSYEPGSIIVQEGDIANEFYIIIEGITEVIKETTDSQIVVLNQLKRGDYFGEIAMLMSSKRTATVRVISSESAKVLVIDRKTFVNMISQSTLTRAILMEQMRQRLGSLGN